MFIEHVTLNMDTSLDWHDLYQCIPQSSYTDSTNSKQSCVWMSTTLEWHKDITKTNTFLLPFGLQCKLQLWTIMNYISRKAPQKKNFCNLFLTIFIVNLGLSWDLCKIGTVIKLIELLRIRLLVLGFTCCQLPKFPNKKFSLKTNTSMGGEEYRSWRYLDNN